MHQTLAYMGAAIAGLSVRLLSVGDASSMSWDSLFQQLGVFAVVIVVFRWMLNRSDERDKARDIEDRETVNSLREELRAERTAHQVTREALFRALANKDKSTPE